MKGILYGVGVGPGDPELMTVKTLRLVSTAKIIAYLSANGGESTARAIAAPFMPGDAIEIAIDMPMRTEPAPAQQAYDQGAKQIAAHLRQGHDVVMLCEGDPFFYGSFIFMYERLSGEFETRVVPGVTSVSAAAAVAGLPLATRNAVIKVLPATLDTDRLRGELATVECAAIIKVGRHFTRIRNLLEALDLSHSATVVEKATHADQSIRRLVDVNESAVPYFTTILVHAAQDHA